MKGTGEAKYVGK